MKLLIVSQYFWPESFGINDVARVLSQKNIQIEVITGKPNYPSGIIFEGYKTFGCQFEIYEGIFIHHIPLIARGRSRFRLGLNYFSFILSGLFFPPWILRKRKFDVIFVYAPSPILQAIPAIFL